MKNHLKTIAAPKTWSVKRKEKKFVVRSNPGPHNLFTSIPIAVLIRESLGYARTMKEVKFILNNKTVLVNNIQRKDPKFPVGFMDVISFTELKDNYRILYSIQGKLVAKKIPEEEKSLKIAKIKNKTSVKGKFLLNLHDGTNIEMPNGSFSPGDSVVYDLDKKIMKDYIKLDKGVFVFLTQGKHIGKSGVVEEVSAEKVKVKSGDTVFETKKDYAYVIGTTKPLVTI